MDICTLIVRYGRGPRIDEEWPEYKMEIPNGWIYDGYEDALMIQPKWQVSNAFWFGYEDNKEEAKKVLKKLYTRYEQEGFLKRFIIDDN